MLRACVLDFQGRWEEYLSLAEFSYNNNYQTTIKTIPLFKVIWTHQGAFEATSKAEKEMRARYQHLF